MSGRAADAWHLRLARPEDAGGMAALAGGEPLAVPVRGGHTLVAYWGGALAGMLLASAQRRTLRIDRLYVRHDARRQGIGAGLVRACLIDASNAGFRSVTASAWAAGPAFYARFGFAPGDGAADRLVRMLGGDAGA